MRSLHPALPLFWSPYLVMTRWGRIVGDVGNNVLVMSINGAFIRHMSVFVRCLRIITSWHYEVFTHLFQCSFAA